MTDVHAGLVPYVPSMDVNRVSATDNSELHVRTRPAVWLGAAAAGLWILLVSLGRSRLGER